MREGKRGLCRQHSQPHEPGLLLFPGERDSTVEMRQRELGDGLSIDNRLDDPGRERGEAKDSAYVARVQPGFPGHLLFGVNLAGDDSAAPFLSADNRFQ